MTPADQYAVVTVFMDDLRTLATAPFCYLTTTGRRSGRPHTIEIWFALHATTVYLLSGGRENSDWVKNLQQEPAVQIRIGTGRFTGRARVLNGPPREASLPVAIDLQHHRPPDFEPD